MEKGNVDCSCQVEWSTDYTVIKLICITQAANVNKMLEGELLTWIIWYLYWQSLFWTKSQIKKNNNKGKVGIPQRFWTELWENHFYSYGWSYYAQFTSETCLSTLPNSRLPPAIELAIELGFFLAQFEHLYVQG